VGRVEVEAGRSGESGSHIVEDVGRDVHHGSAVVALRVQMLLLAQVVARATVPDMHVGDDAKSGQRLQGPVDRGAMDPGCVRLDGRDDVLGRRMVRQRGKRLQHGSPRVGDPLTAPPKRRDGLVQTELVGHPASVPEARLRPRTGRGIERGRRPDDHDDAEQQDARAYRGDR